MSNSNSDSGCDSFSTRSEASSCKPKHKDKCKVKIKCIKGPTGPKGKRGCPGKRGKEGQKGDRGCRGPRGNDGDRGSRGPTGPTGSRGVTGPTGAQGMSGDFPFLNAFEVISWDAAEAWKKASIPLEPLGQVGHQFLMMLHRGKTAQSSTPLFQNIRITSKDPGAIIEISVVFYPPFNQMQTGTAVYSAGDTSVDPSTTNGVSQPITVDNNNSKATFILQEKAFGVGLLYLTFIIDPLLI
uniref:Collagen triple helix repeat protein n=1 Tax=Pithovirus LCPAC406 TaxID=2506599 RepID=A0A481ZGF1_9VIRU|nr:MAG: collagen triple helix repeat protein [Pithovirus LCPAC406]